jgi:hypothetical protein
MTSPSNTPKNIPQIFRSKIMSIKKIPNFFPHFKKNNENLPKKPIFAQQ